MPKFSVRKPYTVLVTVIAVIVLGVVSLTNMTPDLLPTMELPYVVVVTSYAGASPEKVEAVVTKPLEQTMATLENIESISSTSSDNVSMLMLEFSSNVNLEAITVDMLQKISQLEGYWDDMVGTPLILKLNPDMLPVMVAAVELEGMDTAQLSMFIEDTLQNKLEGISGVASVTVSGLVESQVNVILSQEKIDAVNRTIADAINKQFSDLESELADGREELEKGLSELKNGISAMEDGVAMLQSSDDELSKKEIELMQGKLEIARQMETLSEALLQINEQEASIEPLYSAVIENDKAAKQASDTYKMLSMAMSQLDELDARFDALAMLLISEGRADLAGKSAEQQRSILDSETPADERYIAWKEAEEKLLSQLGAYGIADKTALGALVVEAEKAMQTAEATQNALNAQLVALGTSREELEGGWSELQNAKSELNDGYAQLEAALRQLEEGEIALAQALSQLDSVKLKTQTEISLNMPQLTATQAQLEGALEELNAGLEELQTARENALAQVDLNKIVTRDMISGILTAQNFSMPAGYVTQDDVDYLVRVGDNVESIDELSSLLLFDPELDEVSPVYLSDVAEVYMSDNLEKLYARINGNDGIVISFNKQNIYATADVTDNINEKFEELSKEYQGLKFTQLMDQGDYIYIVVDSIVQNLLFGAVFAIIILFMFLKDLRPTFITLCSIPISVMFALVLMYFSGVTLNIISLSGLAVAVGMLVDNSVVVIENIFRLRAKGFSAAKAAITGATQVAGAITSSTLTTICVFAPIVFIQGITRQLFTDIALTLAYALLASLIVAMTLVPAMAAGLFRNMEEKPNKTLNRVLRGYETALGWTLKHKAAMLILTVVLLAASAALVIARGFAFMPEMDMPQLSVTIEMPEGSSFEELKETSDEVSRRLLEIDGVETVGAIANSSSLMSIVGISGGSTDEEATSSMLYVIVEEGKSGNNVSEMILDKTADINAEIVVASNTMSMDMLGGTGVSMELYGNDTDSLFEAARQAESVLLGVDGIAEVDNGIGETEPEIRFVVDKNAAMENGLTVAQVFQAVSAALSGDKTATSVTWDAAGYDVVVSSGNDEKLTPDYIENLEITVTGRDGEEKLVPVTEVAEVVYSESPIAISRIDQRRYISVAATLEDGYNVTLVTQAAESAMKNETLPLGVSYKFSGENETIMDAFSDLVNMLLLGILLVYLIMVAQFQSLKSPFIVMFTIPLAFTGGFIALLITGFELSVVAMIGFAMLVGIIVNNGIVLVDYINQLRQEGYKRTEAIILGGITRLRPVLMTSLTTILGLLTMAIGFGTGSELMQPVAIVCIGGLTYATLMTLFIIPIIYDIFNKKELRTVSAEDLLVDLEA